MLNSNIPSTCPHNMTNFGPITAEIGSGVWGTRANFNWFRVLPSLLHRRRLPEANLTLHYVWPSPELVHCIYIFRGFCPLTEFCGAKFTLAFSYIGSVTARHSSSGRQPNFAEWYKEWILRNFRTRRHLYSAGQPSRLASAHILVLIKT